MDQIERVAHSSKDGSPAGVLANLRCLGGDENQCSDDRAGQADAEAGEKLQVAAAKPFIDVLNVLRNECKGDDQGCCREARWIAGMDSVEDDAGAEMSGIFGNEEPLDADVGLDVLVDESDGQPQPQDLVIAAFPDAAGYQQGDQRVELIARNVS